MIERWEQICQQWIDHNLEHGSDDEVFSSGYLQGHFAVVLSKLEAQSEPELANLTELMSESLSQARSELAPEDMVLVQNAWQQLHSQLAA
ncbi:YfcL family protein [Ferrimonas senticii]|uniref:YfcL family protein n=1 Tax=Ferrimonas senticii TaxID=394566 RepID=UPI00040980AE|nr:YfcL family protein [Ferrimonas senticii]